MARSIVSMGTDESRAFWYIVRSVGFPSRSPPPSRAATSTWRIILANSLPRALSKAPFLCFVVAHLECPDMVLPCPRLSLEKQLVQSRVAHQLGMEGADQDRALAADDGLFVPVAHTDRRQHLHIGAGPLDHRSTDENGMQRPGQPAHVEVGFKRVPLAAERVAPHRDVYGAEAVLVGPAVHDLCGQHYHARARAQGRH